MINQKSLVNNRENSFMIFVENEKEIKYHKKIILFQVIFLWLWLLLLLEPRLINDLKVIIVVISGHNCYLPALSLARSDTILASYWLVRTQYFWPAANAVHCQILQNNPERLHETFKDGPNGFQFQNWN